MIDLLKRWAELQPDWCRFDKYLAGDIAYVGEIDPYVLCLPNLDQEDWATLQRIVQGAIASQGFEGRLNILSSQGKPEYSADVWRGETSPYSSEPQDESAIALLSAYVAALGATVGAAA